MHYLLGGSGGPNYGDELIIDHWLKYINERARSRGEVPPTILVDNNSSTTSERLFSKRYPNALFRAALKRVKHDTKKDSFMANLKYGLDFLAKGHWRKSPECVDVVEQLSEARSIHLYGGGYINTVLAPASAFLLGAVAALSREFKLPAYATGIGITPLQFKDGEDLSALRTAIDGFVVFELRDFWGFNRVKQIIGEHPSLLCGMDDAFLHPIARSPDFAGRRKLHLSGYKSANIFSLPATIEWLQAHEHGFDDVLYWECAPQLEEEVVKQVTSILPRTQVVKVEDLLFNGIPVDPGDFMLTMRFHPHLVASRLGSSGQYAANSTYYEHKHGAIVHAGSRFTKHDPTRPMPGPLKQPILWRDAGHVLSKRALAQQIYG